jgi:hypothetical protein
VAGRADDEPGREADRERDEVGDRDATVAAGNPRDPGGIDVDEAVDIAMREPEDPKVRGLSRLVPLVGQLTNEAFRVTLDILCHFIAARVA